MGSDATAPSEAGTDDAGHPADAGKGVDAGDGVDAGKGVDAGGGGIDAGSGCNPAPGSTIGVFTDPVTTTPIAPPNPPGITFKDTQGNLVDAHGGGIIKDCDTFYLHGEYFLSTTTDNDFNGFSMYSSKDLATWKNEGIILPQQASGQLGPNRKGERPHIIQCPSSGEFVLYAHAADTTYQADKEVVYATSPTVNGQYAFKGSPSAWGSAIAAHSDMSALSDGTNAYVVTESGWVYTLSSDCHSWASAKQYSAVNGTTGGGEAPTVFRAGNTWYWIMSDKTGWRANDNFYSTAPAITGPWTYQGYVAPMGDLTLDDPDDLGPAHRRHPGHRVHVLGRPLVRRPGHDGAGAAQLPHHVRLSAPRLQRSDHVDADLRGHLEARRRRRHLDAVNQGS